MSNVFIVWSYDDGILSVFFDPEKAKEWIEESHDKGFYHREDLMVYEAVINE